MNLSNHLQLITDPSDFKNTKLPILSELDLLKRCYICKEFFKAPVITSCNHTFCSQCIREYLISNNLCPLCKTEVFESSLKRDVLLEEIVLCYKEIRPYLLKLIKNEEQNEANGTHENNGKRKQEEKEVQVVKKPKVEDPNLVECPVCNQLLPMETLQNTNHIDECGLKRTVASRLRTRNTSKPSSISSFFKSSPNESPPSSPNNNPNTVPTKLGHDEYYFNSKTNVPIKRLAKLDYSSLTTPKLKEKLSALTLPINGNRNQLELRYNEYFVLFNSNLDSNRPVSEKVLLQKLQKWESSHSAFKIVRNSISKSITDKNFSVKEWMDEYSDEFKELVKSAKQSMKKSKEVKPEENGDNDEMK
ncbi:unnamed protein product [Candida verbasci]|uniref:Postreplication repair E3 ubiquitin-protein ligase RAD18 n=1 Tax=Candida verbasci TaxID=1227364 RepID=A0A9W4U0W7_9ASCO|nr:unnamed protein product [Candida verbasci]